MIDDNDDDDDERKEGDTREREKNTPKIYTLGGCTPSTDADEIANGAPNTNGPKTPKSNWTWSSCMAVTSLWTSSSKLYWFW